MAKPTDWKAEAKRWRHGINTQTATDEDLTDFIQFKLWEYNEFKTMDNRLWSFFQNDFKVFSVNTFLRVHKLHLYKMYAFLRRGGVYIRTKEKRTTYAQLLFELTQEERQYSWTQENLLEVYEELDRNGFQSDKMNNAVRYGLNYKIPQDPRVRTTPLQTTSLPLSGRAPVEPLLFQPQRLSGVQTASQPLSGRALVGPLPLSGRVPVGPSPIPFQPQQSSGIQTASLPPSRRAPVGPLLYISSLQDLTVRTTLFQPQQPSDVQTASLPLSRGAPVGPSLYTMLSTPEASFAAQPTEPLPNQKVDGRFSHSRLGHTGIDAVGRLPKEVTGAVVKEWTPTNEPTNQTKSLERQNKVLTKTPIRPCLTPQILKMTTTTDTALNPCTSSSSNCPDETSKEEIEMSDEDETRVDIGRSRQVDSSGNQDQATDQEELNPQDDDVIGPQASKDDPPPGLPTPAQSPEPQPNTASTNRELRFEYVPEREARPRQETRGDIDNNKLVTSY